MLDFNVRSTIANQVHFRTQLILRSILLLMSVLILTPRQDAQQTLIGDGELHPSAILQIESVEKGILIPRMSEAEIMAIPNPTQGLQVYNLANKCVYIRNIDKWAMTCPTDNPRPQANYRYKTIAPFPISMAFAISFVLNGEGYVGLGIRSGTYFNNVYKYNDLSNEWTEVAPFPDLRRNAVSFTIGNFAYVGLGRTSGPGITFLRDFYKYDSSLNSWEPIAIFPGSARSNAASFTHGNEAYVIGGFDGGVPRDCYKYSPETNAWTQIANIPGAVNGGVGFTLGDYGYTGTSENGHGPRFFRYDPASDTWQSIPKYPKDQVSDMAAFTLDGKAYVGTGTNSGSASNCMYSFDPDDDSWTQEENFPGPPISSAVSFTLNGSGYVGLGISANSFSEFYKYESTKEAKLESYQGTSSWNESLITYTEIGGILHSQEGGTVNLETGLTADKIIGVSIHVLIPNGNGFDQIPPNTISLPESEYFYFINPDGTIEIKTDVTNSGNIVGQSFSVLVSHLHQ